MLSSLFRHLLLLLRRDFPFPSLTSDVLGSLVLHLASQLSSPAQKRVMRFVNAAIVLGLFWPRCLASHSSRMLCLKAAKASASGQSTIWFFLVRNLFQSFRLTLQAVELYGSNRPHPEVRHKSLGNLPERRLRALPNFQWSFREAFEPVTSWPFELEG